MKCRAPPSTTPYSSRGISVAGRQLLGRVAGSLEDRHGRVRFPGLAGEADDAAFVMHLEPRGERVGRREARQELPERSGYELEVDQDVVERRHLDRLALERSAAHLARRQGERAHRLDPPDRAEDGGHLVQAVDPVVEDRADALAVERRRVAGVLVPGRRARVGVVRHRQGGRTHGGRPGQLPKPAHPLLDGRSGGDQELHAAGLCQLDQGVGLGDARGDRLLAVDRDAGLEERRGSRPRASARASRCRPRRAACRGASPRGRGRPSCRATRLAAAAATASPAPSRGSATAASVTTSARDASAGR